MATLDAVFTATLGAAEVDYAALADEKLLRRAAGRDNSACSELVRRYGQRLYAIVQKTHGDLQLSDDIVQDTFIRAIERHEQLRSGSSVFPWLVRIALRRASDCRRKTFREALVDVFTTSSEPTAETALDQQRQEDTVRHAMTRLKPFHREVLYLLYYAHFSVAEIAEVYGKTVVAIRKDLQRARAQLKRRLPKGIGELR